MSNPAASTQPDPLLIQVKQLEALQAILASQAHLPVMSSKLDKLIAENAVMRQQLEIANKPVQSVWFKARLGFVSSADADTTAFWKEHFGNVLTTAEDSVKAQLAAWKADPANNGKLVVAETLIPQEQEALHTNGAVYTLGFVYLHVQYKEL